MSAMPAVEMVPAEPVREHIESLQVHGNSLQAIADAAGLHRGTLMDLLLGPRINGGNQRASLRATMPKARAEAILAVGADERRQQAPRACAVGAVLDARQPAPQRGRGERSGVRAYPFLAAALHGVDLAAMSQRWNVPRAWLVDVAGAVPVTRKVAVAVNLAVVQARTEANSQVTADGWGHKMIIERIKDNAC